MKEKKIMSVGNFMFWSKTVIGILWCLGAVMGCFEHIVCLAASCLFALAALMITLILRRTKREKDDELSLQNFTEARAKASTVMTVVFLIGIAIGTFSCFCLESLKLNWTRILMQVFYLMLGIQELSVGIIFKKLEAE